MGATRRARSVWRWGGYAAYLCVVVVVGAEVVLRMFDLAPTDGVYTVTQEEFERIPGIFSPGRSIVDTRRSGLHHRVTIDSLGYRGRDFARARAPGELRIVVVGDSFVWGDFVDDEATLPAQLEKMLRAACGHVTVVNAGVPSTTIDAQVAMAMRSLVLDPQVVVLVFHDNDLINLLEPNVWEMLEQNRLAKSRFPLSLAYPVLRRTALWNLGLEVRRRMLIGRQALAVEATENPLSVAQSGETAKAEYLEHLARLDRLLGARAVGLIVAAYPGWSALGSVEGGEPARWVVGAATGLGIVAVDIGEALRQTGRSATGLYLLPLDGHPSPEGHEVAARAVADRLLAMPAANRACGH